LKQWHLAELWDLIAHAIPDAPALMQDGFSLNWRTYAERAARIAAGLRAAGVGPDTKVGIYGFNSIAYLEAQYGVMKARGVPVNVNYHYTERELIYLLENADIEVLFFDAQFGPRIAACLAGGRLPKIRTLIEIDDGTANYLDGAKPLEALIQEFSALPPQPYSPDDVFMIYTGGTTGLPKGVIYRQGDFAEGCLAGYSARGFAKPKSAQDVASVVQQLQMQNRAPVLLPACPLMHGTALFGTLVGQNVGGSVVLYRNTTFDADHLWSLAEQTGASDILIAGDAFARPMLTALERAAASKRPYDLSTLKGIFSGGVTFSREVKEGLLSFADIVIWDALGASEGSMAGAVASRTTPPAETSRFFPNPTTKVFRDDGTEIGRGSGEIGLVANGGAVPIGYYKDPVKSASTFRVINGHRYSVPGDYAMLDDDGALILVGRGSGCINTGGEKVFPEEVENILRTHPSVDDCIVMGMADERFGQRVVAIIEPRKPTEFLPDAVTDFVKGSLANYKAPREIIVVDHVQRHPNGKPDYAWAEHIIQERSGALLASS
jgi:fatty-acyl-CoA synthase